MRPIHNLEDWCPQITIDPDYQKKLEQQQNKY